VIIIDNNVTSELMKPLPSPSVVRWVLDQDVGHASPATGIVSDLRTTAVRVLDPWSTS
jgi:hypothetical protein